MADCKHKIPIKLKEPIIINEKLTFEISVPCGKCTSCIERRKMEWSFRIENEMEHSKVTYFVTLTYSPENVPYNKYGLKTLVPTRIEDLKLQAHEQNRKRITKAWKAKQPDRSLEGFWKRLRINQERTEITNEHLQNNLKYNDKIKYYAAGEYGEERGRPHYHAIIFNASQKIIEKSWTLGTTHIVKANKATINYVMKYLDKRIYTKQDKRKTEEFNSMSEGIGINYIEKNRTWHNKNIDVLFVTTKTGIKIPMPKYYRLKLFTEEIRKIQMIIVETTLTQQKEEDINKLGGIHEYTKMINQIEQIREKRFQRKIKKRNQD